MELEYNSNREPLLLKEYGRNVQKLVNFIAKQEDKEKRSEQAAVLVKLMTQLNPSIKANSDNLQRVWDHMYVMSDFQLDIEGPFPPPEKDAIVKKPEKVEYRSGEVNLKHYGRNLELTIQKVLEIEDETERHDAFIQLARTIKTFYHAWYKEVLDDASLISDLNKLSKGATDLSKEVEENPKVFEVHLPTVSHYSNRDTQHKEKKGRKRKRRR